MFVTGRLVASGSASQTQLSPDFWRTHRLSRLGASAARDFL